MGLTPEEIRRAKMAKNNKEKGIVPRSSGTDLSELKRSMASKKANMNDRIKSLTAQSIDGASAYLEQVAKTKVELVFIFDRSGSCQGTEASTIKGFNDIIAKEKRKGFQDVVTTVLFNHFEDTLYSRLPIKLVPPLKYVADGGTALYDTLCNVIGNTRRLQNYDRECPEKTMVVIMTDGYDESSQYRKEKDVRDLITDCRKKGWEFIFLGVMNNTKKVASDLGIDPNNAERYCIDGISYNFESIERALDDIREGGEINEDWAEPIINNRPALPSSSEDEIGKQRRLKRGN